MSRGWGGVMRPRRERGDGRGDPGVRAAPPCRQPLPPPLPPFGFLFFGVPQRILGNAWGGGEPPPPPLV